MSKKLLSEAQVRRFQALATIKPINEMAYNEGDYNEELVNEEEEMEMDDAPEADEMDEADVELDEELVEKFMDAVSTIQQVADALGGEVDADMDMGGDDMDLDMDAGDEAPMELDAGDEGEGEEDEGEEDEEAMLQEALSGINYIPSQKEIVKTVAQRVAKRLNEAKRAEARLNRALGKK